MSDYIWRCDLLPQYEAHKSAVTEAIERVLASGRYMLSTEVKSFESEFAEYADTDHGVSVASGTDGLILSLLALGIGRGDEVITTPFTAIPTLSAIVATGATPVFVDICGDTYLMDIEKVGGVLTKHSKAIVPVHLFGNMVDIAALREALPAGFPIVEDACQAHGSMLHGRKAGVVGDCGVFSFYPTKNLGGYGDGGIVITSNEQLAESLLLLRMYGMTDPAHISSHGYNSRLDELQAAILRAKLPHLDAMNEQRNIIAGRYRADLNPIMFEHQKIQDGCYSNYHILAARFTGDRQRLQDHLEKMGVQTNVYYPLPLHLQKANAYLGLGEGSFPVAEALCKEIVALPMYAELPEDKLDRVIDAINTAVVMPSSA